MRSYIAKSYDHMQKIIAKSQKISEILKILTIENLRFLPDLLDKVQGNFFDFRDTVFIL